MGGSRVGNSWGHGMRGRQICDHWHGGRWRRNVQEKKELK